MVYVFDSSFVATLIIPDEKNPQVDKMYTKILNEDENLRAAAKKYGVVTLK